MTTKAIVGITLCILGIILSLTVYGLFLAPIFFLPGIPLSHAGLRVFKVHHGRTSAALVVTLTLSYIASVCSVALIVTTAAIWTADYRRRHQGSPLVDSSPATNEALVSQHVNQEDSTRMAYVLAKAYRAKSSPLSRSDTEILLRFGGYGTEWNRASARLLRDYLDPKVTGDQWIERSRIPLAQLRAVLVRTETDIELLSDTGAKESVRPIVEIHDSMVGFYTRLQFALVAHDTNAETMAMAALQAAGRRKQQFGLPIVQSLREQLGTGYMDRRLQEMITEIGDLAVPK